MMYHSSLDCGTSQALSDVIQDVMIPISVAPHSCIINSIQLWSDHRSSHSAASRHVGERILEKDRQFLHTFSVAFMALTRFCAGIDRKLERLGTSSPGSNLLSMRETEIHRISTGTLMRLPLNSFSICSWLRISRLSLPRMR